jgi:hypothetical protein
MRLCRWVVAAGLAIAAAAVPSAGFAEPPAGSRNFNPPVAVPNYFSNESGPILGTPAARPSEPAPAPAAAAPTPVPAPTAVSEAKPQRHIIRTAKSRDRSRTAQTKTRAADKRKSAVAGRAHSSKAVTVAARSDKPRSARLAHAEPHTAKAAPAAAKGQRTRAAEKRSGRG